MNMPPRIDAHLHLVGTGAGGTGCWLRVKGWRRPFASLLLRHIGLAAADLNGDFDRLYVERLRELLRTSSLAQAVILAQDLPCDASGNRLDTGIFYVPNDYALQLARKYPEFLPGVSIHPGRPDALEELERCLAQGAALLKLLPNCQNVDCSNPRYTRFWERLAEAGLPFLAHTGGEHTLPVLRPEFSDPRTLIRPLEVGVTVIAAHCGTKSGLFDPQYFHVFADLTHRFSNLYGDNSAFNVPLRGRHARACLEEPLASRIIYGSDLPVPVHGHFAWLNGDLGWKTFRHWENHPNPLERDYQFKLAMGFSAETFTRVGRLLRKPTSSLSTP